MVFAPIVGVRYQNSRNDAFSETGAGVLNISAAASTIEQLTSTVGIELAGAAHNGNGTFTPRLSVAWQHEFLDTGLSNQFVMTGSPTQFLIASPTEAWDSVLVSGSVEIELTTDAILELDASAILSDTSTEYGGSAAIKLWF